MAIIFVITAVIIICEKLFFLSCEIKNNQSIKSTKTKSSYSNNDYWFQNEMNRQQQQLAVDESIRHNHL